MVWDISGMLLPFVKTISLTLISLASYFWDIGKYYNPDVTPQNAAFYLGLFCLLKAISSKNELKQ